MSNEILPDIDGEIEALVDGNMDPDDAAEVDALIIENTEARERMFALARINAQLRKLRPFRKTQKTNRALSLL